MDELRGEEEEKKNEVLEKANTIRNFYLEFCDALDAAPLSEPPDGNWKVKDEPVLVSIVNDKFSAIGSFQREREEGGLANALLRKSPVIVKETISLSVNGHITGRAVRAIYNRSSSRTRGGLLSGIPIGRDVLLIMASDVIKMLDIESGQTRVTQWDSQNSSAEESTQQVTVQ